MMLFFVFFFFEGNSQQLPLYSQYMMNGFLFNPAVAGSDGFTTIGLSTRDHMLGFDYSPKTYALSIQGRILRKRYQVRKNSFFNTTSLSKRSGRVGLGGYLFNDKNGYVERVGGQLSYAYHIFMQNRQLSFGLAVTTFQFHLNTNGLKPRDPDYLLVDQNYSNKLLVPDMTAGVYYTTQSSYIGFSIANIFQTRIKITENTLDYRMYRHYFLMGCWRFNQEELYSFEPSFLLKGTEKMGVQADLQMRLYYNMDYYTGVCFRTGSALGFLVGAKINRFCFSYAFDYSLRSIQNYSYGSHELNLAIKLGDNARRYRWLIRY